MSFSKFIRCAKINIKTGVYSLRTQVG